MLDDLCMGMLSAFVGLLGLMLHGVHLTKCYGQKNSWAARMYCKHHET